MSIANANEDGVLIPIPRRSLGEFISGLLGQRREISRSISTKQFLVDYNWIAGLDDIVTQRVSSQNEGQLVDFCARIFFDDGRVSSLTTQGALRSFRDLSSALSVGIEITWHFLILFPGRSVPEKQEVRFVCFSDDRFRDGKPQKYSRPTTFANIDENQEHLKFSVSFTDLSWGEDVAGHITRYIDSTLRDRSLLSRSLNRISSRTLLLIMCFLCSFGMAMLADDSPSLKNRTSILEDAIKYKGSPTESISIKIDALASSELMKLREPRQTLLSPKIPLYFQPILCVVTCSSALQEELCLLERILRSLL